LGIRRGWAELQRGADMKIPQVFRFFIAWVTPIIIFVVFIGALVKPEGGDWGAALAGLGAGQGWSLAPDSVLGKIFHVGQDYAWFTADGHGTRLLVEDATRGLLLLLFAGLLLLTWNANRRRKGGKA
jgi:hypothetical protein